MRVALEWILDYVDTTKKYSATEIADALTSVGLEVESIEEAESTSIFEINVTPNRADCLGVYGLARELAAKLKEPLKNIDYEPKTTEKYNTSDYVNITADEEICPRFVALAIEGIPTDVQSPLWLTKRLENSGMRPLNLIVDITNYVMLELGQPIHAYDQLDIEGKTLTARRALQNEKITTLDAREQQLTNEDIVVADKKKIVDLAGIMGGVNTQIKETTSKILVEVACFDPVLVRKTSKKYGYRTEASFRFERGIDIQNLRIVALRVAYLLQLCEGSKNKGAVRVASSLIDEYPHKLTPRTIALRPSRLESLIGERYGHDEIISILESIGVRFVDKATDRFLFETPSWRLDLEREVDLIEEVSRLYGFDRISAKLPKMSIEPNVEHPFIEFTEKVRSTVASFGLNETISYSFVAKSDIKKLKLLNTELQQHTVDIANALNEEMKCLRPSLSASLINAVRFNERFNSQGLKLFEIGRSFLSGDVYKTTNASHFLGLNEKPIHLRPENDNVARVFEKNVLAGVLTSPFRAKSWDQTEPVNVDFFTVKKLLNSFFHSLNLTAEYKAIDAQGQPHLHPAQSADIFMNETNCGYLGALHPMTLKQAGIHNKHGVYLFELNLERVFKAMHNQRADFSNFSWPFPTSSRDIGFLVDKKVSHDQISKQIDCFISSKAKLLKDFELFDLYEGDKLAADEKSLAYRFHFKSAERTLTEAEVEQELSALISALNTSLGLKQRV